MRLLGPVRKLISSTDGRRFFRNLSKYLLFALVIALSTLPVYIVSMQASRESEMRKANESFSVGYNKLTDLLDTLVNQADMMTKDTSLLLLLNTPAIESPPDYHQMVLARNRLRESIVMEPRVSAVYLMSAKNGLFLSNALVSEDRGTIYDHFYSIEGMDQKQWEQAVFAPATRPFFLASRPSSGDFLPSPRVQRESLHLVVPVPVLQGYSGSHRMVYVLDTKAVFSGFMSEEVGENCFFYLCDASGNMLCSNGYDPAAADLARYTRIERAGGEFTATLGISEAYFSAKLASVRLFLSLYALFIFVMALLLSVFLTFRQQVPLLNLMRLTRSVNPQSEGEDEYAFISGTIAMLDSQRKQYAQEIKEMEVSIYGASFEQALSGRIYTPSDEKRSSGALGLEEGGLFRIVMMKLLDPGGVESTARINAEVRALLRAGTDSAVLVYNRDEALTYFLLTLPPPGEADPAASGPDRPGDAETLRDPVAEEARVYDACHAACARVRDAFAAVARFGIGHPVRGVRSVHSSAKGAESALWRCQEGAPVRAHSPGGKRGAGAPLITSGWMTRMRDILSIGSDEAVGDFFAKLDARLRSGDPTQQDVRQAYYCLRNTLLELGAQKVPEFIENFPIPAFDESGGAPEMLLALERTALRLSQAITAEQSKGNARLSQSILDYVDQNYADPNLCAGSIAEAFHISEKYVFLLVKGAASISLGEYIERRRFDQVERLLLRNTNVNSIPELVGFNSTNTFYKAFKRIYGTSPLKWRDTRQAGGLGQDIGR